MRTLELRVPPVAVVLFFAVAMVALAYGSPSATVPFPAHKIVAVLLLLSGGLTALLGVIAFRRHHTTVNPYTPDRSSTLVATGIYRHSRNPMYLGFLLALIGWCVYLANIVSTLLLPLFVFYMNRFQIIPEERVLTEKFGEHFNAYKKTTRRWL